MFKVYVIVDSKMKCDVLPFIQSNDGAAGSFFYNWCLVQKHREFSLYSIGGAEYVDNQFLITDNERKFMVNMPEEEIE